MRKIIGFLNTGMNGCSVAEAYLFKDTDSDTYINNYIHSEAVNWASSYLDVVAEGSIEEDEDYVEGTDFEYENNIDSYWEDYNPERHEGEYCGDGSFAEDFERLLNE